MLFLLSRDERGATAIEYALIGALVGLGLVGSLLTTKGSLNSIFGFASGQMASAGSDATPTSLGQTLWASKTLASNTVTPGGGVRNADGSISGGVVSYKYNYTDGSFVEYYLSRDLNNVMTSVQFYVQNPSYDPNSIFIYRTDANGVQTYFRTDTYAPGSNYGTIKTYAYQNGAGTTQFNGTCNGSCSATSSTAPTAALQASAVSIGSQVDYFKTLSAAQPIK